MSRLPYVLSSHAPSCCYALCEQTLCTHSLCLFSGAWKVSPAFSEGKSPHISAEAAIFPSSTHIILKQMFTCDAKFAKASVSSWELWKNVMSVMSLCESAWKLCVLEDEFIMEISKSPCQGPYCPSSVSTSSASSLSSCCRQY